MLIAMHYFTGRNDKFQSLFKSREGAACQLTPTSWADKTYSAIQRFVHQKFQKRGEEGAASSSELSTLLGFTSHSPLAPADD